MSLAYSKVCLTRTVIRLNAEEEETLSEIARQLGSPAARVSKWRTRLTFNRGWDQAGKELRSFTDVRELQRELKTQGLTLTGEADESSKGPASLMLIDPDGNQILIDQHR